MTATTPESRTKRRIKDMLKRAGVYYFMPVQQGFGAPSLDFIGARCDGMMFAIEAKRHGEQPTPRQWATINDMRSKGIMCFVVDDETDSKTPIFESVRDVNYWLDKGK